MLLTSVVLLLWKKLRSDLDEKIKTEFIREKSKLMQHKESRQSALQRILNESLSEQRWGFPFIPGLKVLVLQQVFAYRVDHIRWWKQEGNRLIELRGNIHFLDQEVGYLMLNELRNVYSELQLTPLLCQSHLVFVDWDVYWSCYEGQITFKYIVNYR